MTFGWDHIEREVFHAVLEGDVDSGGTLPEPGPDWFVDMISGWARFMRWNMTRCIADSETSNGADLSLSHESVRNGLRGLPEMFALLPELEELLV